VLTVSGGEVGLKLCPSLFSKWFFVPLAAGHHEVPSCKYVCISNVDFLWVSDKEDFCLIIICTILNLLEQGFNRLLGIPCSAHVFKVVFKIDRGDVAIGGEDMVEHVRAEMLAKPTMSSFKTSKHIGSKTLMICFLNDCCTEVYVR
jgi:hypothetical protein